MNKRLLLLRLFLGGRIFWIWCQICFGEELIQGTWGTSKLYMKVDGVCETIYSTSRDKELLNGTLEPGGITIVFENNTHMTDNWAYFTMWTIHLEACYCLMPFLWGRFDRWKKVRSSDDRSHCTCSRNIFERDDDAEYEVKKKKATEVSKFTHCCFFGQISCSFWWRTRVTMKWSWYFTRSCLSSWRPSLL